MNRDKWDRAQSAIEYLFIFGWSILVTGAIVFVLMNMTGNLVGSIVGTGDNSTGIPPNCTTAIATLGDLVVDDNNMDPSIAYNMAYSGTPQKGTIIFDINGWDTVGYHCIFIDGNLLSSTTNAPILGAGGYGIETNAIGNFAPGTHSFSAKSNPTNACPGLNPAGDDYALLNVQIDVNYCN